MAGPVTVDGTATEADFEGYDTNLFIPFDAPVAPGASAIVRIPFMLVVGHNAGALGGRLSSQGGTIEFGEWFPVWSTQHGFSDIGEPQVTWNADSIVLDLTSTQAIGRDAVASSGQLQDGATDSHWTFEATNVRDFAFAVNPAYRVARASVECGGSTTAIAAFASHVEPSALLATASHAMKQYDEWYGCYGYPTFTLAEVGSPWFSMEFPTMVFIGARVASSEAVIDHETAHQWWYGLVGDDQITEPWLDEAFAEFSAQALTKPVAACRGGAVDSTIDDFADWSSCGQYIDTVYERGAQFLATLRAQMGDDAFFGAMKTIVTTYRYGIATTNGVLAILTHATNKDLTPTLNQYGFAAA
jgi:hypothetical protein